MSIVLNLMPKSIKLPVIHDEAPGRHFCPHLGRSMGNWILKIFVDMLYNKSLLISGIIHDVHISLKIRTLCLHIFPSEIKCIESKTGASYLEPERYLDAILLGRIHCL